MLGKTVDCYVVGGMVREVEMACNWFRRIFNIFFNVAKLFAKMVCKFSPFSFKVDLFFLHKVRLCIR